jgi:16S rRNA (cytosine1402-N4)-methyltransferase
MPRIVHVPVLLDEVIDFLKPKEKEHFIDGTVGQGGHAEAILERTSPSGRLLGIDRDPGNLSVAENRLARFAPRAVFVHDTYAHAVQQALDHGFEQVNGILLDLGFSSAHIEDPKRGFSFMADGPLDMRYDPIQSFTADIIVNQYSEEELARLFRTLGEESRARQIAKAIVDARRKEKITSTLALAQLVASAVGGRRGKIHPATKVFQALRIAVNDELGQLERALPELIKLLAPGGRLAVITFHSLEDRVVKQFFAAHDGKTLKNLTKKVVKPGAEEIRRNPRARSAKLRVAERI